MLCEKVDFASPTRLLVFKMDCGKLQTGIPLVFFQKRSQHIFLLDKCISEAPPKLRWTYISLLDIQSWYCGNLLSRSWGVKPN